MKWMSAKAAVLGIVLIIVAGCEQNGNNTGTTARLATELEIEDFEYSRRPDGTRLVSGTVVNNSEHGISHAEVEVGLYDHLNRRLDQIRIAVEGIEPLGRKTFTRTLDSEVDFASARVNQVVVFGRG